MPWFSHLKSSAVARTPVKLQSAYALLRIMESESIDDSDFLCSFDDVFTGLVNFRIEDAKQITVPPRRLSVKELKILRSEFGSTGRKNDRARIIALWRSAYQMVLRRGDPWAEFQLNKLPVEFAKRYRYSPLKSKWAEDMVRVRMEQKSFGRGAMRECFRVKKLSNFSHNTDWSSALNFVAKRYIDPVAPQVYFDDVRLQMDAKLWAEEFSRQPPIIKKVDVAQMCVLEFINRPDKPLYHLEHFIEGTYRKYNSNSGFVDDFARNTPQAFSHFTFEQSGHRLLVVDIQGVGDLWTDPQIHTSDGHAYGDGNLGIRGMALFFHTHRCNPLCVALQLDPFDLHPGEQLVSSLIPRPQPPSMKASLNGDSLNSDQLPVGRTVALPQSSRPSYRRFQSETNERVTPVFVDPADFADAHSLPTQQLAFLPASSPIVYRALHLNGNDQPTHWNTHHSRDASGDALNGSDDVDFRNGSFSGSRSLLSTAPQVATTCDSGVSCGQSTLPTQRRCRHRSGRMSDSCSDGVDDESSSSCNPLSACYDGRQNREAAIAQFFEAQHARHRSSSVAGLRGQNANILGLIHHELARLHASGRFASSAALGGDEDNGRADRDFTSEALVALRQPQNINWEAVLFHEEQASLLNCFEAIDCLSNYYLGLVINGPLEDCPIAPDPTDAGIRGLSLISTAASAGDRRAMMYLAEMNYTGQCPVEHIQSRPDWIAAVHWYDEAIKADEMGTDEKSKGFSVGYDSMTVDWPIYRLHGRLAEMYAKGEHGLKRDIAKAYALFESAADGANEAMQGRLAMQYYQQAALLEEEFDVDE